MLKTLWVWCVMGVLLLDWCWARSHICDGVQDEVPAHRLSTKTSYFNAEKESSHWEQYNDEVWGCTAQQVWLLNRHGTRYPSINNYGNLVKNLPRLSQQIEVNHQQGRGCLEPHVLQLLKDWFPPYEMRDKENLQETGYEEMAAIGEHWRDKFPHLFNVTYDSTNFKIDYTVRNRTSQSAYHFLRGMFGEEAVGHIELPEPYSPNFILQFDRACPRWLQVVYNNTETTYKEKRLFVKTEAFQGVVHAVSARLGFMHPLTTDEVEAVYDECRFETAWWPARKSPWCAALSTTDFEVLEYYQDLKYYYEDSYGHPLNLMITCRTLSDMFTHFMTAVNNGKAEINGIFYFTHDKILLKVLASVGLLRPEEHLRHDNFARMKDRSWRTSFLSPFGANLAFVLYRCGLQYRVGVLFEGEPTPLTEHCLGVTCRWEELLPFLQEKQQTCDLSKLCMLHDEL